MSYISRNIPVSGMIEHPSAAAQLRVCSTCGECRRVRALQSACVGCDACAAHGQATCAKTGDGLMEGMEWIAQRVKGEAVQALHSPQASPAKAVAA